MTSIGVNTKENKRSLQQLSCSVINSILCCLQVSLINVKDSVNAGSRFRTVPLERTPEWVAHKASRIRWPLRELSD